MNYRGKNIETQASGFEDLLRSGDFVLSSAASFGTSGTSGTSPSWRFPKLLWQNEPRNKLEDDLKMTQKYPDFSYIFLHFPWALAPALRSEAVLEIQVELVVVGVL